MVDQERQLSQCDLSQAGQVRRGEEVFQGSLGSLGRVDLPGLHLFDQVLGRDVDVHDLVGVGQNVVGQPLLDLDPRRPLHLIVQAFQMLDVHCRDHVNAST